jgi:hypothetical protein
MPDEPEIVCKNVMPSNSASSHTSLNCTIDIGNEYMAGEYESTLLIENQENIPENRNTTSSIFYFYDVEEMYPRFLCESGSTSVYIRGTGFPENKGFLDNRDGGEPVLKFGNFNEYSEQTYLSYSHYNIEYSSDKSNLPMESLTKNMSWHFGMGGAGKRYLDSGTGNQSYFEYYRRPMVSKVIPWAGPSTGNMDIHFHGEFATSKYMESKELNIQVTKIKKEEPENTYNLTCANSHYNSTVATCKPIFEHVGKYYVAISQEINQTTDQRTCYSNEETEFFVYPFDLDIYTLAVSLNGAETVSNEYFHLVLNASFFYNHGLDLFPLRKEVKEPFLKVGDTPYKMVWGKIYKTDALGNALDTSGLFKLRLDKSEFSNNTFGKLVNVWIVDDASSSSVSTKRMKRLPHVVFNVTSNTYVDIWTRTRRRSSLGSEYKIYVTFSDNGASLSGTGQGRRLTTDDVAQDTDELRPADIFSSYINFKAQVDRFKFELADKTRAVGNKPRHVPWSSVSSFQTGLNWYDIAPRTRTRYTIESDTTSWVVEAFIDTALDPQSLYQHVCCTYLTIQ